MKFSIVQYDIHKGEPDKNRKKISGLLKKTLKCEGSVIILPEMFSTGFITDSKTLEKVNPEKNYNLDTDFLSKTARTFNSWVLAGCADSVSESPSDTCKKTYPQNPSPSYRFKYRNLTLLFSPEGKITAKYIKVHLFPLSQEPENFISGAKAALFNIDGICLQPSICYDLRFPELYRKGIPESRKIITVQANWPAERKKHWTLLLKARAIENRCYVIGVNGAPGKTKNPLAGSSMCITPDGKTVLNLKKKETIKTIEIDTYETEHRRMKFNPYLDKKLIS